MGKNLGFLLLTFLGISCLYQSHQVSKVTTENSQLGTLVGQDSSLIEVYAPYKKKMNEEIHKVLSYAPKHLTRTDGKMQSSLGNLIADLMFEKANSLYIQETGKEIDFVFSNYGGMRSGIWEGDVRVAHVFNLMPFDNTIVVVELTREKVEALFQFFLENNRAHPLSKQVQVTMENKKTIKVLIHGKPLEDKTYFVATSNYLQRGGNHMNFFGNPKSLYDSNFLIRDAIAEYFGSRDTLVSQLDKRVLIY